MGGGYKAFQFGRVQRARPQEPLVEVAAPLLEQMELSQVFNAFDDDLEVQFSGKPDHCLDDDAVASPADDVCNHRTVDLDGVERKRRKIGQAGIARAEVVDRDTDARGTKPCETACNLQAVLDQAGFDDLDRDLFGFQAGRSNFCQQPLLIAGPVEVAGQQVDRKLEAGQRLEPPGECSERLALDRSG